MKTFRQLYLGLSLLYLFGGCGHSIQKTETWYFAAESKGVLCGYSKVCISPSHQEGRKMILLEEEGEVKLAALGTTLHTKFRFRFHIDPETGQFFYHESDSELGNVKTGISIKIRGNEGQVTRKPRGKRHRITLPPGTILANYQIFPHLVRDFVTNREENKSYKVLDLNDGNIHQLTYTKLGIESLELMGHAYKAVVLDEMNQNTGQRSKLWINPENGYRLKRVFPNRTIFLTGQSVRNKIKTVNIDDRMVAKVNLIIPDVSAISYMKVKTRLEPTGLRVTTASLNVPGQTFQGTVKDNVINGIFEVSYKKYDGKHAPPFPPSFNREPSLKKYLEPEDLIESNDPVLVKTALELTRNAEDSWDALKRLSQWVAEEIIYDIPGGGSARNTYDLKMGECSAHSLLLAAFCRAAGIPARVTWGCMYIPHDGGGFVQHAWNEVYMGGAGWIPVDTTADEVDFVDSGHIRIGTLTSRSTALNPKKMEILDYRPLSREPVTTNSFVPGKYEPYVGDYRTSDGPYRGKTFKVFSKNLSLAVEIPGRGVLDLMEPDEDGDWFFKATRLASIAFQKDETGKVSGLALSIRTRLPKKIEAGTAGRGVPEKFKPYLGQYPVPMEGFELTVIFKDDNLAVVESDGKIVKLKGPDKKGLWVYKPGRYMISFIFGDSGDAKAMVVHQVYEIPRARSSVSEIQGSGTKEQDK